MSKFENVTVVREANVYFDGGVTSRTIEFPGGETKTLGVMLPGEYKFDTGKPELMEIQAGEVSVLMPGADKWLTYKGGESFNVPGDSAFEIKAVTVADYCCSFLDA
ncbi:MAG: pyrimidine/purine nucleoside phosphorylase [Planctomycetota bacterium]|jgi:uncharacterized protein YaiE (UPF0345 family)